MHYLYMEVVEHYFDLKDSVEVVSEAAKREDLLDCYEFLPLLQDYYEPATDSDLSNCAWEPRMCSHPLLVPRIDCVPVASVEAVPMMS